MFLNYKIGNRNFILSFMDLNDPNFTAIGKKIKCAERAFFSSTHLNFTGLLLVSLFFSFHLYRASILESGDFIFVKI